MSSTQASGSGARSGRGAAKKEDPDDDNDELFLDMSSAEGSDAEESDVSGHLPTASSQRRRYAPMQFGKKLTPPRTVVYTCAVLYRDIKKGNIDLEAEYQRDVVWLEHKQSSLVDSILRNYHLPQILFSIHKVKMPDGSERPIKVCVDGKQRLTSIYKFMNNEIGLRDPGSKRTFFYSKAPSDRRMRYVIDEDTRESFDMAQINCVEFSNLTDDEERDIFQRVQLGTALTPAEKLQARVGPWPDLFRELSKRFCGPDGLGKLRNLDKGKDWLFMAVTTVLIYQAGGAKVTLPSAATLGTFMERNEDNPPSASFRREVLGVFQSYYAWTQDPIYARFILPEPVEGTKVLKTLSPMEFTYVGYMIWACEGATLAQMSELVTNMKRHVRAMHTDVMLNAKLFKTVSEWFEKQRIPGVNIKKGRKTNEAAAGSKRGREVDEAEYRPVQHGNGAGGSGSGLAYRSGRRRIEDVPSAPSSATSTLQHDPLPSAAASSNINYQQQQQQQQQYHQQQQYQQHHHHQQQQQHYHAMSATPGGTADYSLWGTPVPGSQGGGQGSGNGTDAYVGNDGFGR